MKKSIIKIFLPCFLYLSLIANLYSQSNVLIQDGVYVSTLSEGEILSPSVFSAYIEMKMKYDSTLVYYRFSDCKLNSNRIRLQNWWRGVVIDTMEAVAMSNLNRTDPIELNTNDTLNFFRNFLWINRFDNKMEPNNFFSRDTLIYMVELLEEGSQNRLAMLDSFCVLRKIPSGSPNFLGIENPFKKVNYIVPSSMNGKQGFIKLSMYTNGDGAYYPARRTGFGVGLSQLLTAPSKASYRELFGVSSSNKVATSEVNENLLSVSPNPSRKHTKVSLSATIKNQIKECSITVSSITGKAVQNLTKLNFSESGELEFDIEEKGVYFITLENKTGILARKKVIIN